MARSFKEILRQNQACLDEIDARYWVARYLSNLLKTDINCSLVDNGRVVIVVKHPALRQELKLIIPQLRRRAYAQLNYQIREVIIKRH